MDKMTRKVLFAFVGMICAAALILVFYYLLTQGKISSMRSSAKPTSEVEKLLSKDLDTKYPETPTEVVKLYWRFNKCIYNNSMNDKKFKGLLKQLRKMYDDELLELEDNSWDNMLSHFQKDKTQFVDSGKLISTYTVQQNSTVVYGKIKGRKCAAVITATLTKENNKRKQTYEKFLCRQDKAGKWRILGWERTNNKKEIATLGED